MSVFIAQGEAGTQGQRGPAGERGRPGPPGGGYSSKDTGVGMMGPAGPRGERGSSGQPGQAGAPGLPGTPGTEVSAAPAHPIERSPSTEERCLKWLPQSKPRGHFTRLCGWAQERNYVEIGFKLSTARAFKMSARELFVFVF